MNLSVLGLYATYGLLEIRLVLHLFCSKTRAMLKMLAARWTEDMFAERKFAWKWLKDRPEVEDLKGLEKSVMSAGESVTSLDSVEAEGNQAWVEIGIADQDDRAVGEF